MFDRVLNAPLDPRSIGKYWTQPTVTCSKLTTETLEQGKKFVQS